jgi:pseudaminic acid synthase
MKIASHDTDKSVFIIAELSANHNQDFNLAKKAVEVAKEAGCDAIKLQTYTPDSLTLNIKSENFKAGDIWSDEYLYDLYSRACTPYSWHQPLKEYADKLGIILFSSPFDFEGVDLLEKIGTPAYKIASFEITDIPLIRYVASKNRPIIISTGIADIEDIELAILTCKEAGNSDIALLKCTSAYPAKESDMNLLTIRDMRERFDIEVGLSDHSLGTEASIAAVALGARIVEKHFTPDSSIKTADSSFSLSPIQLKEMVTSIRRTEQMLGDISYGGDKKYARSLFTCKDIKKGEHFSSKNIKSVRPNLGLHPKFYDELIGKVAKREYKAGEALQHKDLYE